MRNNLDRLGTQPEHDSQASTNQGNVFSYVVPTQIVDLPSRGTYYPVGHPLFGKESLEIKEMTAKEEDILYNKSFLEKGVVLDKLLQSIIVDKTINVDSILIIDKNALLVAARSSGYGAEYEIEAECANCLSKFKGTVDLKNLLRIEEAKLPEGAVKLDNGFVELTLPVTKWKVQVKLLNGADQTALNKTLERKKKNNIEENAVLESLKSFIVSINGRDDHTTVFTALMQLPAKDSKFLRNEYASCFPNVKNSAPVTCTVCDHTEEYEVPFNANFFWTK